MAFTFARARTLAAGCIGIGSIGAGLVLAFRLVTPGVVDSLRTSELMGLIGLMVLPIITLWALASHARFEAQAPAQALPEPDHRAVLIEPKLLPARAPTREEPPHAEPRSTPGRRTPQHRRHEPSDTRRTGAPTRHDMGAHH